MRWSILACALIQMVVAAEGDAVERRCPLAAGSAIQLTEIDGEARLAWIDSHLASTAETAKLWTWGWTIGMVVATIGNLAPVPYVARQDRIDWYTGAATTIVGIIPLVAAPLAVIDDSRTLRREIAARDDGTDLCVLLADAEERLLRDAEDEASGQRWWMHAGNVVLNVGVGLFLGLGYHHWKMGAVNAVGGAAIGELIILSQPTTGIDDLKQYRSGEWARAPENAALGLSYAGAF